ncbi:MAG: 16S rRNA (guanine(966)-N(2))-methyltransferase RsmD [Eubacteriales bacterium]
MRVIAGTARSLPLKAPVGLETRPTTDRVKETLFNMINPLLPNAIFVDVFSGSGGIGIEALSRGASKSYFIENNRQALLCIQENLSFTKLMNQAVIYNQDAIGALSFIQEEYVDIIFMDPPYQSDLENSVLKALQDKSYIDDQTIIIIEAKLEKDFSFVTEYGFYVEKEKKYKTNKHVFIKKVSKD